MSEREDNVYKAKLAEQAERYDGKKKQQHQQLRLLLPLSLLLPGSTVSKQIRFLYFGINFSFSHLCFWLSSSSSGVGLFVRPFARPPGLLTSWLAGRQTIPLRIQLMMK